MFPRFTVLLPDAAPRWERWWCPSKTTSTLAGTTEGPALPEKLPGRLILGLPSRACRTFAVRIPSQDAKTARRLAVMQLEKRGLATAADPDQTPFECHLTPLASGGAVLSVDTVSAASVAEFLPLKPAALIPAARCFPLPERSLVLTWEQEHGVLLAGNGGRLVHAQLLSAPLDRLDQMAAEIRITALTLFQQGLVPEITGLEIHGHFPEADAAMLGAAADLVVSTRPRPAPDPELTARFSSARLLPAQGRAASRGQRLRLLKMAAAVAVAGAVLLWWAGEKRSLSALEKRAAELEGIVSSSAASHSGEQALGDRVRGTQERWQGLRMALDPKRYPMLHLNSITRCLGESGVVLTRFESKGPDLGVTGTAGSAAEAYTFYTAVNTDPELRVYDWSMVEPVIAANGMASFNLKGKMR